MGAPRRPPRSSAARRRRVAALGLGLLAGLGVSACGAKGAASDGHPERVAITATPSGCPPHPERVRAGPIEVAASNLDAPTVWEIEIRTSNFSRVMGEKENLIEGLSATFSADLSPGRYVVNCPGAARPHWPLVAVATPASSTANGRR